MRNSLFLCLSYLVTVYANMSLIVEVKQGKLKGRENLSVLTGQKYYTFSGIPYAKPPEGDLRFKDPQPYEKWEGIYDATYERNSCFQQNPRDKKWTGSEDCLYLNVNTPEVPSENKSLKAVMVFIHGGGYFSGSGSEKSYSADYMIPHDVVFVTMNYRLYVLGFLNLGIPHFSGNAALKDQSLALKWVKENIIKFGGDPNNITLFGESAGGASVHFQVISPLSKGLFDKAIIQSGNVFVPWAKGYDPSDMAKQFGQQLGFTGDCPQTLLKFLQKQTPENLGNANSALNAKLKSLYPGSFCPGPFLPSVELVKDGAFLPESPEELIKNTAPLPIIYGVTNKEGYLFAGSFSDDTLALLKKDFSILFKNNFNIDPKKLFEVSAVIKNYYLGDKEVGNETSEQMSDLCSDIMYLKLYEAIDFVTKSPTPPYVYEFDYDKDTNDEFIKRFRLSLFGGLNGLPKNFKGAPHGAELPYLFFAKYPSHSPPTDPDDLTVINNMTTLWTNFAKTGIPNEGQVTWTPSTSNDPYYLEIDTKLEVKKGKVYGKRLRFLKSVLEPVIIPT